MASVFQREGSKVWIASYRDASGSWRQRKGTGSKQDTLRMARKLERAALERGLQRLQEDPFEQHLEAPIAEHIAAYLSSLRNLGRDETYVLQVDAAIRRVVDAASLKTLQDLDVVRVADAIDGLQKAPRGFAGEGSSEDDEDDEEEGVSRRTKTTIATRLRGFARWLVKAQRLRHDPLAALAFAATRDDDEGRVRRSLTREETARLLTSAERRPESELRLVRVGKHKGEERAKVREKSLAHARRVGLQRRTIYLLVLWSGLRRSEVEKLQWGDLTLDSERPVIQLRASATKSRRADRLPIHSELQAALMRWREAVGKPAKDPKACVFPGTPSMKAFKADLTQAGIAYEIAGKGVVDFHALRKTYSTLLAAAHVPQRIRQAAMRHADPRLTETTYMDEEVLPVFEHVSALPPLGQATVGS
jgi:integrase